MIPAVEPSINHTYLQFWYSSVLGSRAPGVSRIPDTTRVHLATTSVPIPYDLSSSWPGMEHIRSSADYGCYDTRLDPLITTRTLQCLTTHNVRFKKPFPTPPRVLVWLTGVGARSGALVCVKATANNVTESEFSLHITSGGGDLLGSVGVGWAVWPETPRFGETTAKAGSVSTVAAGARRVTNLNTEGKVAVVGVEFASLCALDLVLLGGLWVIVQMQRQAPYEPKGTTWTMSAGPVGSHVYSARIAYSSS